MGLSKVLAQIRTLKQPMFQTRDIVASLDQPTATISQSLLRLSKDKHLIHLHKGLWAIPEQVEPWALPGFLTAPFPCYISLQTALYHHGMIEQIPEVIYAVSIGRTKKFHTPIGDISIHHIPTALFFGYQEIDHGIKIATPEKALFDFLYLQPAKTRLFARLPELEIPKHFDHALFSQWLSKIKSPKRRTMMVNKFQGFISHLSRSDR